MAVVSMTPNPAGIERLRTLPEALLLTDKDKKGPLLIEMDVANIKQVKRAFTTKGASVRTGPWRPWSPRYAAWRQKHGLGKQMLRLHDSMFGKFTARTHRAHIARWRSPLKYDFGARDDVAFIHQNPKASGRPNFPKRSVIDKTSRDHKAFVTTFVGFYKKHLRRIFRNVVIVRR
jgi:hypothetical protein